MGTAAMLVLATAARILTLEQAVDAARQGQPQLAQAHANSDVFAARAEEARAPLLPQVNATFLYQRTTANFILRPGVVPTSLATQTGNSFETFNFFNGGLVASQYLWDFGQTTDRFHAAESQAAAARATEFATQKTVLLNVRTAFFNAVGQKSLRVVAQEALANQQLHVKQVQGFVQAGTHPEIDVVTAESTLSSFEIQLIGATSNYDVSKVRLNQAMGVLAVPDFEVSDEWLPAVDAEDQSADVLLPQAEKTRPELAAFEAQIRAQQLIRSSISGQYYPAFNASFAFTDGGTSLSNLGWNLSASLNASWNIFSGYNTRSQDAEAHATLVGLEAQRALLRQQVLADLSSALVSVRAAKATGKASETGLASAREQLRLAQARFASGLGNAVELGDAEIAVLQAGNQKVQAEYALSLARAQLLQALGRDQ